MENINDLNKSYNQYESKVRDFLEDLERSNDPDLRKDWLRIFKLKFGEDIIVLFKDDKQTQRGFGTDVTIQTKKGRRFSVELKTRNYRVLGKDYIMEIVHNYYDREEKELRRFIGRKEGWIYNTTAEYIFHATLDESGKRITEVIFYSLIPFKTEKYKSEFEKYKFKWLSTRNFNNFQRTLNKLIPKEIIKRDAVEFWEWNNEN